MNYTGLNSSQIESQRQKYGSNKLPDPPQKKWYDYAKEALNERITLILLIMAAIMFVLFIAGVQEISDPVMIVVVLGIVVTIAVKTGLSVQKSARLLREKTATRYCNVIRDGKVVRINKNDIVVGDVLCLESGQEIYADGYIIEGKVSVSNAAINGETKECHKTPVEGYKYPKKISTDDYTNQNCLFAGTTIVSGEGKMLVTTVGINTVNGDTLVKMQTLEAPKTALDIALDKLADFISRWGTVAAVIGFLVSIISGVAQEGFGEFFGDTPLEVIRVIATNISVALTIIVAAVPEGLPLIVKLVTKMNVRTMEKFNILAKNPNKIPELAYVNFVCTDKTGTLTTGVMTPKAFIDGDGTVEKDLKKIPETVKVNMILNNSATFANGEITGGNSIDRAVLSLITPEQFAEWRKKLPQKLRQPFSSSNKYSAYTTEGGTTYYKGAPERIIEKCSRYIDANGYIHELSDKEKINGQIHNLTTLAMRCIAFAYKEEDLKENELPEDMIFCGILGVQDPVRAEVPEAVRKAKKAGVMVVEITGDCIETAVAVAKEAGIYTDTDIALTDNEFAAMTDDKIKSIISRIKVIARCSPSTKLRLVMLAQEMGYSVAMTGDGSNDSAALKRADVGFAMNSGTDVAKEAGDVILMDDNFASIIKGIELGRTFMHNIMMFLNFQLPINYSLLISNLLYPIFFVGSVLTSVLILVINIIMDSCNSLSFGGEPPKEEYMSEAPLEKGKGLFVRGSKKHIAITTVTMLIALAIMVFSPVKDLFTTEGEGLSARFALVCIFAVINGFTIRTESRNLFRGLSKNKLFMLIAVGIIVGAVLLVQFGGALFHTEPLGLIQWAAVVILSLIIVPVDIVRKTIEKRRKV